MIAMTILNIKKSATNNVVDYLQKEDLFTYFVKDSWTKMSQYDPLNKISEREEYPTYQVLNY